MKEEIQEARCDPMPLPPKIHGNAFWASQLRATQILQRIQTRIGLGNIPICLLPPSDLGNNTMSIQAMEAGHDPVISQARKISMSASRDWGDNRAKALGENLSAPKPVPMGKEAAAATSMWTKRARGQGGREEGQFSPWSSAPSFQMHAMASVSRLTASCSDAGVQMRWPAFSSPSKGS